MRELPPTRLVELLQRLGLAAEADLSRLSGRVRRLARGLPAFESVWVDALAQARILTAFQAREINAGRGSRLAAGPYVLCELLEWPSYGRAYRALDSKTRESVRLVVSESSRPDIVARLEQLVEQSKRINDKGLCCATWAGVVNQGWAVASPWIDGESLAQRIVRRGRFPNEDVLDVARKMLAALSRLEEAGLTHGDVCAQGTIVTGQGELVLVHPGLRGIVRPDEGFAHNDLPPEAFDYLAPERLREGAAPSIRGDLFSCACMWWHLLAGRPPFAGGNSLEKLRCVHAARIDDVRRWAPDTPATLAAAIGACLQPAERDRPESAKRAAEMLASNGTVAKAPAAPRLAVQHRRLVPMPRRRRWTWASAPGTVLWLSAAAGTLLAVAAIARPLWQGRSGQSETAVRRTESSAPKPGPHPANGESTAAAGAARKASVQPGAPPVIPATHLQPVASEVLIDGDDPKAAAAIRFQPGLHLRGDAKRRARLVVPAAGLVVPVDDVCFEDVDFVWPDTMSADSPPGLAMIGLGASRVEFRRCMFVGRGHGGGSAIAWKGRGAADATLALPSGRIKLSDCVFFRVDAAIDWQSHGALAAEVENCLHAASGPLLRVDRSPGSEEPLAVTLARVTLRESGPLLECAYGRLHREPGALAFRLTECVLAPEARSPLLLFRGESPPQALLSGVHWTGQGSLVGAQAAIAGWQPPHSAIRSLDDATLPIEGLVRSAVEFSGATSEIPEGSRLVRWQGPLRSPNTPGVEPAELPASGTTTFDQRRSTSADANREPR